MTVERSHRATADERRVSATEHYYPPLTCPFLRASLDTAIWLVGKWR
jgi:hypothetical protein